MSTVVVNVGTLGRAHGLFGQVFVDLSTDSPEVRFKPGVVVWVGERALTVKSFHVQSGRGLVCFTDVTDREAAAALTGLVIVARVDDSESPGDENEYYDHQLIGLAVVSTEGSAVGQVTRVDHLGFQDMLVVETQTGERLVPFVDDLVPVVDLQAGQVVVRAIPGLLEDEL